MENLKRLPDVFPKSQSCYHQSHLWRRDSESEKIVSQRSYIKCGQTWFNHCCNNKLGHYRVLQFTQHHGTFFSNLSSTTSLRSRQSKYHPHIADKLKAQKGYTKGIWQKHDQKLILRKGTCEQNFACLWVS